MVPPIEDDELAFASKGDEPIGMKNSTRPDRRLAEERFSACPKREATTLSAPRR
jgi:hypothetical protein